MFLPAPMYSRSFWRMKVDLLHILNWLAWVTMAASFVRVGLYRLPDLLKIWIAPDKSFWLSYGKMVQSADVILGWLSGALAKFGKSHLVSEEHQEWLREKTPIPQTKET